MSHWAVATDTSGHACLQLHTNALVYCCAAVLSLGRLVNPVTTAMLADAVEERDRAVCFPVSGVACRPTVRKLSQPTGAAVFQILQAVAQAGPLVGYFIGYFTLSLYLENYKQFWLTMGISQLGIVVFLCEPGSILMTAKCHYSISC
jgi:hypothetical protein